jgi:PAS domain S-box-containing protein
MGVYNPRENCYRWININAVPIIRPGEDKPFEVYTLFNDITERKQDEETLRESEERYRTLFNSMEEGFCIIEMLFDENEKPIDYIFVETNPAFERGTGLKNAVGKRIRELAPENEEYWYEIYGKVALTGESVRFENRAEALNRWYEVYAYHIGQPESRNVAILFNDITARKRMEEELKQSEKQYRTLGDTIPYGIWLTDASGYCTYTSPSFLELVDMSMEQVQKFGWLHLLPPEDVQPTTDHWLRCFQTGEDFEREHRFRAEDGSYRNVLAIADRSRTKMGKSLGG